MGDTGGGVSTDIPTWHLALCFLVVVGVSLSARALDLGNYAELLTAGVRALVQLSLLGFVLKPIFLSDHPLFIFGYVFFFMVFVSAHEASARPKVVHPRIFYDAFFSLAVPLFFLGGLLLIVVAPTPWYKAQYVIPMAGMLINNALTSSALALNSMVEFLTTRKEHLEALLGFGATPWEAARAGFVASLRAALIPAINGMNVIGLVSIPGMMTGQILGGADPSHAAKYQVAITFMILGCSFTSVFLMGKLTIRAFFDDAGRHDTSHITPQKRLKVSQLLDLRRCCAGIKRCLCCCWRTPVETSASNSAKVGVREPLMDEAGAAGNLPPLVLRADAAAGMSQTSDAASKRPVLNIDLDGLIAGQRPLSAKFSVTAGQVICIMGPSGIGKSTLLKWISDLRAPEGSAPRRTLKKSGDASMSPQQSPQSWRREVLYVQQSKAPMPGTPRDFVKTVSELSVNRGHGPLEPEEFAFQLGLTSEHLDRAWNELSGGEAQRAMIAISLAARPACLLLDEPTSALDESSKKLVEAQLASLRDCAVILVTHDAAQAQRLGADVWRVVER
eukprot:TRINITY_DN11535_c0_g1_i1.p1 TRINITY_DN11535_c0_g1~~TRINITY_DN11535_c0_g1_i1.p1  ORF type:complete len:575 (-),score=75.42 TRINITY_DN11535_c0_g1_i1:309-1988(-)